MWIGTTFRYDASERSPTSTVWSRVVGDASIVAIGTSYW